MATVYNASAIDNTNDGGFDQGTTIRHIVSAAALSAAPGNQVQVQFRSGNNSSGSGTITGAWIGQAASAGSINFKGNQVQLKFSGSNTFVVNAASTNFISDVVTLGENFDNTKDYLVSFRMDSAAPQTVDMTQGAIANVNAEFLQGSTAGEEALTTASAGYTAQSGTGQFLRQIIITGALSGAGILMMGVGP